MDKAPDLPDTLPEGPIPDFGGPPAPVAEDDGAELTEEQLMYADQLGYDETQALAFKGFIQSCMSEGY